MSTPMTPLLPDAIRARRRPFAILSVYLAELAWALLVATPVHAWARRVWGAHPDGDAVLWMPDGRDLLVWFGQEDAALGIVSRVVMVLIVVSAIAMQVPLGALIASLAFERGGEAGAVDARRSPRWQAALRVGIGAFMPLAGVLVLGSIAAVIVLGLGGLAAGAIDHGLAERLGDARSFQLRIVTLALFGLVAAGIGVIIDLARAAIARDVGLAVVKGTSASGWRTLVRGLRVAFTIARRRIGAATLAWGWRALLSLGLIALGAAASQALGGKGGGTLVLLWLTHQAIILSRVALRASWLARALAFVAPVQDAPAPAPVAVPE